MDGAFSILVEKSGAISDTEGEPETVNALLPLNREAANLQRLFPKEKQEFAAELLSMASNNSEGRISDLTLISLRGETGQFNLTIQPTAEPEKWWFRLVPATFDPDREPSMIWFDYFDSVSYLVDNAPEKPIELMMLNFAGLENPEISDRIGKEAMNDVRDAIEVKLANHSLSGQVGRMDSGSYALIIDAGEDADDIIVDVGNATKTFGIDTDELGARSTTVALDAPGSTAEDTKNALADVRRSFLGGDDDDEFGAPTVSLNNVMERLEVTKTKILAALEAGDISLTRFPVIALSDGSTALHLAYRTLMIDGEPVKASQNLILGDYPGLTLQHDLTMVREAALEIVAANKTDTPAVPLIIDINAASLASDKFVPSVSKMMDVAGVKPDCIGFRTLSLDLARQSLPGFQNLQKLLRLGHRIWLTRFASAVTDATMEGAYVEVTVTYLERLCDNPEGKELVAQLLQVWRNAAVQLVAIDVQSTAQRKFIADLGIGFAIGPAAAG